MLLWSNVKSGQVRFRRVVSGFVRSCQFRAPDVLWLTVKLWSSQGLLAKDT